MSQMGTKYLERAAEESFSAPVAFLPLTFVAAAINKRARARNGNVIYASRFMRSSKETETLSEESARAGGPRRRADRERPELKSTA